MKRQRGRRRSGGNNNNNHNNPNRHYESVGPDVKIRGSAQQVLDKYLQYARDAQTSGDRITSEAYYQFAEHYQRIVSKQAEVKEKQRLEREARDQQRREEREARQAERGEKGEADADSESSDEERKPRRRRSRDDDKAEAKSDTKSSDEKASSDTEEKPRKRRSYKRKSEDEAPAQDDGVMKTLSRGRKKDADADAPEAAD